MRFVYVYTFSVCVMCYCAFHGMLYGFYSFIVIINSIGCIVGVFVWLGDWCSLFQWTVHVVHI